MSDILIKTEEEIAKMREGGHLLYDILQKLKKLIERGEMNGVEINAFAEREIEKIGAKPAFKGYQGFPAAICFSINDAVVHGIPTETQLNKGDLVKVDCGLIYKGMYTDSALTTVVGGEASEDDQKLMKATQDSLYAGIDAAVVGNKVGDISAAVEDAIKPYGYGIVRKLAGHGVGRAVHEAPEILNFGQVNTGPLLKPGMTIAIEPMINAGGDDVFFGDDRWTVKTADGSRAAHFEHTIAITKDGPEILTLPE
jgi:methionyl aminopeptidase